MADKQDRLRKHIKSARGWLGWAESSLDDNNEVRGDLSIMLAQAELQHAQEVKHKSPWLVWLKRLSPVLIALLVGAGYMALLRPTDAKVIFYVQPDAVSAESVEAGKTQPDVDEKSDAVDVAEAKTEANSVESGALASELKADSVSSSSAAGSDNITMEGQAWAGEYNENSSENTAENAVENKDSQYDLQDLENRPLAGSSKAESSVEMHKLMQSAGKILRE